MREQAGRDQAGVAAPGDDDFDLAGRLTELRLRYPASRPEVMAEVVRAVIETMRGDLAAPELTLLGEVEALGRSIAAAKAEIAQLGVDDINASHIPSATDELDAIVSHTASATDSILEVCETLDRVADSLSGQDSPACIAASAQLQGATTRIYEACSFQDITGQRITKVVATLKAIELKIATLVAAFGRDREDASPDDAPAPPEPPERLTNGPQLPANAMDQSDIDRLLASFD
jgi:chemotaxis protein CheZ